MNVTPASLKTQRRKDFYTMKKSLRRSSILSVFASLRETSLFFQVMNVTNQKQLGNNSGASPTNCVGR